MPSSRVDPGVKADAPPHILGYFDSREICRYHVVGVENAGLPSFEDLAGEVTGEGNQQRKVGIGIHRLTLT